MKTNRLFLKFSSKRKHKAAAAKSRRPSALIGSIAALAMSAAALLSPGKSSAATYVWDPDTNNGNNILNLSGVAPTATNMGGAGSWDTTNNRWWTGLADQPWSNGVDTAWFTGLNGGAVTFGAPISVGGMVFTTGAYTTVLTATNTLTLGAGTIITADAGVTLGTNSINGILGSSGFTKNGGNKIGRAHV